MFRPVPGSNSAHSRKHNDKCTPPGRMHLQYVVGRGWIEDMKRESQGPPSGAGKCSIAAGRCDSPTRKQTARARGGQKARVENE